MNAREEFESQMDFWLESQLDYWNERLWKTAFDFQRAEQLLGDVQVAAPQLAATMNARAADEFAQVERLKAKLQAMEAQP